MSLRRRLLAALLAVVLISGLAVSAATFYAARAEFTSLLDEELREVALSLREHAELDLSRLSEPGDPQRRVVVQIWDRYGFRFYLSNVDAPLPPAPREGYATIQHESRDWRVFTLRAGDRLIQAAQTTEQRTQLAAGAALRVLLPVLAAMPLLALLVWLVLERGFAPLARLAAAVRTRHAAALEPLPAQGLPEEIAPLVAALNNLLARLGDAFAAQRRFAADAAHELRTPLTALALQIQLVARAKSQDERAAALARLEERVKRATRVIEQLLALTRLEPEATQRPEQRIALDEIARAALADAEGVAEQKSLDLIQGHMAPIAVTASEDALRILIANLVDNAVRYTPAGGRIEVRAYREGDRALFEVADDGPGIPPPERERVFDRFYRGAGVDVPGTGLGLAIARQAAQLCGGRIELDVGLDDRGLTARAVLPAS